MKLYYKEWDKEEVEIPQNGIILGEPDLPAIHAITSYPIGICWEIWILQKIGENKEGYFDFSKNIVDIGAGLAEYCWLLPFKHAYAFEPNKTMTYKIHANAVLHNRVEEIDTFQCLLSDKPEDVNYDGFLTEVGGHSCYHKDKEQVVHSTVLDSFNIDNIGLIKIDVEGMEEKVLRGGIGTIIRSNYPPILFECWDVGYSGMTQEKHDSLFNYLKSLGYEILEHWGDFETHLAIHK